jgi:hypothetical protein
MPEKLSFCECKKSTGNVDEIDPKSVLKFFGILAIDSYNYPPLSLLLLFCHTA